MPGRKWLWIGYVERRTTDPLLAKGGHEIVCDDVTAAPDVDQPRVRLHLP
jgi:hypothetical protein